MFFFGVFDEFDLSFWLSVLLTAPVDFPLPIFTLRIWGDFTENNSYIEVHTYPPDMSYKDLFWSAIKRKNSNDDKEADNVNHRVNQFWSDILKNQIS